MNNNNNNSQFQKVNINTNSLTFFDDNGVMLKCGFLNENISISFGTAVDNNGKRSYPNDKRDNLLLTSDRVGALYCLIKDKFLPAIEKGEDYNGGVFTSMKKDQVFELRIEHQNGVAEIYALFHRNIDANRIPQKTVVFKFTKVPVIEKYNTTNGEFLLDEIDAQFYMFIKLIEGFVIAGANNVTAHSYRNANHYTTDKIFKYLGEMAAKMGISVASSPAYNNGFDKSTSNADMPAIEEIDDFGDLLS